MASDFITVCFIWLTMVKQAIGINTETRSSRNTDSDMVLSRSSDLDYTTAFGGTIQINMTLETPHTLDTNKATGSGPNLHSPVDFRSNTGPLTSTKTLFAMEPQIDALDSSPGWMS